MPERKAIYFDSTPNGEVHCRLCPHNCFIKIGNVGICGVRKNCDGILHTLNYGEVSSLALDPVEKKPLYHFYPGRMILSAGSFGCNLFCSFCQNHGISRQRAYTEVIEPDQLVEIARQAAGQGSIGLAFTYNEPSIWYEFVRDTAEKLQEADLKAVLVTNGYLQLKPLQDLLPFIDAVNIDVKAFTDGFYRRQCKASLDHVKATVEACIGRTHVEITNLVIPGENDASEEIDALARWLATLSPLIPLHLSRYYPAYQMKTEPTPEITMHRAVATARKHLQFVYTGNVPGITNDTICPHCGNCLITRYNYRIKISGIANGSCTRCSAPVTFIKM
jgi:pyruvate formate lyase activating enzyme